MNDETMCALIYSNSIQFFVLVLSMCLHRVYESFAKTEKKEVTSTHKHRIIFFFNYDPFQFVVCKRTLIFYTECPAASLLRLLLSQKSRFACSLGSLFNSFTFDLILHFSQFGGMKHTRTHAHTKTLINGYMLHTFLFSVVIL